MSVNGLGKKLIVSDLDGTLLDNVDGLSFGYVERLNNLIKKGLDFTVCTGRDMENTKIALKDVSFINPIILTNGAILANYPSMEIIEYRVIEHEIISDILKIGQDMTSKIIVYAYYNDVRKNVIFIKGKWWDPAKLQWLEPFLFENIIEKPVISIQYLDKKENLEKFRKNIASEYGYKIHIIFIEDAFLPGYYWLELNPINATKEYMLKKLIDLKGYSPKDVVVFGDQYNDIGMFKLAGTSCAMRNAPLEVQKEASIVIGTNKEGGVIRYLEENLENLI